MNERCGGRGLVAMGPGVRGMERCPGCVDCPRKVDPASTHDVVKAIIKNLQPMEMCAPCNEEHPKGEPCPLCDRTLLLG